MIGTVGIEDSSIDGVADRGPLLAKPLGEVPRVVVAAS